MKRSAALLFALVLALGGAAVWFWTADAPSANAARAEDERHATERASTPSSNTRTSTPAAELQPSAPHANVSKPRTHADSRDETPAAEIERAPAAPLVAADVRGRVLRADDELGQGGLRLAFLGGTNVRAEILLAETTTGPRGDFEVHFELRGTARVRLADGWTLARAGSVERRTRVDADANHDDERELDASELRGDTFVVLRAVPPPVDPAGEFVLRGALLSEAGAWTAETLPRTGAVLLDLVAQSDPGRSTRIELVTVNDANGAPTLAFEVPVNGGGPWELTLSSLDGFRWSPTNVRITGATKPLEFLRYDREKTLPLTFEVTDARTGAHIESFAVRRLQTNVSRDAGVFLHTGPIELGTFPIQGPFQWSLASDGYAPAFGDETNFVEDGERRVARVTLERGWGTKLLALARDPLARPLAGAEVYVDTRFAGRTANDGTLVLRGDARPAQLEVRSAGFAQSGDPLAGHAGRSAEQRGQVTLAFLEPVR